MATASIAKASQELKLALYLVCRERAKKALQLKVHRIWIYPSAHGLGRVGNV